MSVLTPQLASRTTFTTSTKSAPYPSSSSARKAPSKRSKPAKPPKPKIDRVNTDVLLSIKPESVAKIKTRKKNHEFRKYQLKNSVVRLWLYQSARISKITHIMETCPPKQPGELCNSDGLGNDDSDGGRKESKFGYPVLGFCVLKKTLDRKEMISKWYVIYGRKWRMAGQK